MSYGPKTLPTHPFGKLSFFTRKPECDCVKHTAIKEYSILKNKLSEVLTDVICPVGKEIKKLLEDKNFLEKTLKEGTEKARVIAERNLKEIKNVVGFF